MNENQIRLSDSNTLPHIWGKNNGHAKEYPHIALFRISHSYLVNESINNVFDWVDLGISVQNCILGPILIKPDQ